MSFNIAQHSVFTTSIVLWASCLWHLSSTCAKVVKTSAAYFKDLLQPHSNETTPNHKNLLEKHCVSVIKLWGGGCLFSKLMNLFATPSNEPKALFIDKDKGFITRLSQSVATGNVKDPRSLVAILTTIAKDDGAEGAIKLMMETESKEKSKDFDLVNRVWHSYFDDDFFSYTLNSILHNITHVKDSIKRISLLILNGHGSSSHMKINNNEFFVAESAKRIYWDKYLTKDAKIILLSCSTGKGPNSFAEKLSQITQRTVVAPAEAVLGICDLNYSKDLSKLAVQFCKSPFLSASGGVFCPSNDCKMIKAGNSDLACLKKTVSLVSAELMKIDLTKGYICSVLAAGLIGVCLKLLNKALKKGAGECKITRGIDCSAKILTKIFMAHINAAPMLGSTMLHGAQKAYGFIKGEKKEKTD